MGRIAIRPQGLCAYWPQSEKHAAFACDVTAKRTACLGTERWREVKFRELERGAVASANGMYRPACPRCPTTEFCRAARVNFAEFGMTDSQRRKFENFRARVDFATLPGSVFDPDIFKLYKQYVPSRHGDTHTEMADYSAATFKETFGYNAWTITARLQSGEIAAASIIDQHQEDFYAAYQIYDPALAKISPGISMMLSVIAMLRELHPAGHLYVGSWSPGSPKLGYKEQFLGTEVFDQGRWIPIAEAARSAELAPLR